MSSSYIDKLNAILSRKTRLEAELEEINLTLNGLDALLDKGPGETSPSPKPAPVAEIASAVIGYIRAAGKPLQSPELVNMLLQDGIEVGGKSPKSNLAAKLSRRDDLVALHGFGYWTSDVPYAPANYSPNSSVLEEEDHVDIETDQEEWLAQQDES